MSTPQPEKPAAKKPVAKKSPSTAAKKPAAKKPAAKKPAGAAPKQPAPKKSETEAVPAPMPAPLPSENHYASSVASGQPTSTAARINPLALWSMILGIVNLSIGWLIPLPIGIVGIVLGHIGLSQIKRTGENGRPYAIAGLVMGYVGLALAIILISIFGVWLLAMVLSGSGAMWDYAEFPTGMMNP